jgi:hypothetical protein
MEQRDLWDAGAGEAAREAGMALAANRRRDLLHYARQLAVWIAWRRPDREVTADDVQRELSRQGVSVRALGNAAGSLFAGRCWRWTGKFVKSERAHAHRNLLRVWRYIGGNCDDGSAV